MMALFFVIFKWNIL